MLKILFIIDSLSLSGGAENQLRNLVSNLNKDIFEIFLLSLDEPKEDESVDRDNMKVFSVPQKGFFDLDCLLKVKKIISQVRPHIVNTILFTADCYGRVGAILNKVPLIISSIRNIDLWKKKRHRLVDRILNKRTSHFIVNAYEVKEYFQKEYKISQSKISVIYNGIDIYRFKRQEPLENLNGKLDIKSRKVILNIARFSPQKDHDSLIETSKIVLRQRRDIVFILIGKGHLKEKVIQKIKRENLSEFFRILDPVKDIQNFYNLSYLSILTSLYEGCSNFILESMASEVPVIATSVGGNPELIIEAKTGFLVPPKKPQKIAEKVLFLLDNPEIVKRFAKEARKRVEGNFTIEAMVGKYQSLYLDLSNKLIRSSL